MDFKFSSGEILFMMIDGKREYILPVLRHRGYGSCQYPLHLELQHRLKYRVNKRDHNGMLTCQLNKALSLHGFENL